ncbi:glycerophosphodiester phosphodiesterase [Shewanella basaltis]|uniref:glycerophosphodiester phosphodiesterase n=1 Tax=Shewanella basaltis TaxID=472183 RepID=UPI00200E6FBC|nr:glycerophosphodiester phosphodiesterase family protein [Shewanella basaltis]MCL1114718.1 glycerophosphodiester phosphodiesterase [Shewanella basaltis]
MLIFAHRGASGYAPENTLAAMTKAIELGAKAIELDVHCVEGELVVFHDRRLEGKSTGHGLIHLCTLAELTQYAVGGEPIPSLWDVLTHLDSITQGHCIINIEIKGVGCVTPFVNMYPRLLAQLRFSPSQLLISSFNHLYVAQIKQQLPQAFVAPLLGSIPLDLAQVVTDLDAYSIHLDVAFINQAIIDDAHQRGAKVYVYTVDNSDDIQSLKALGVDGVFSNYPDKAIAAAALALPEQIKTWFD